MAEKAITSEGKFMCMSSTSDYGSAGYQLALRSRRAIQLERCSTTSEKHYNSVHLNIS
jgi:hypothetical protein